MARPHSLPFAWAVVLTTFSLGALAFADGPAEKTWSDGICTYDLSLPLEGYLVPPATFASGYAVPPERVLAASRKMTAAELDRYARGGNPPPTRDYPLFVFQNHRVNVFLWKGTRDGDQQIIPRAWNGELWLPGDAADGRADAVEFLFYQPAGRDRCYVVVQQQNGQVGRDRIHTELVRFGAFPPVADVLRKGIETADAVVYRPAARVESAGELLDCLKGSVTRSELRKVPGAEHLGDGTFVFLTGAGAGRKIRATYRESYLYGAFRGEYGELRLSVPQVRAAMATDPVLTTYVQPEPFRWTYARSAAGPRQKDAPCRLRVVNPEARRGEWVIVELTVGRDRPGLLYRPPQRRSQTDGGDALVRFRVRRGDAEAELAPRGRFGAESLRQAAPEENAAVGVEYQFTDGGAGVLKMALRPKQYPWAGTVQGRYAELSSRFDRGEPAPVHVSDEVRLERK